jgi:hypothetical protein
MAAAGVPGEVAAVLVGRLGLVVGVASACWP